MDEYNIDAHKLIYHPDRVAAWNAAENWESLKKIYPLYIEVSPAGACNHRCAFCAVDYLDYRPQFLSVDIMERRMTEMARAGVKSIMFAGI